MIFYRPIYNQDAEPSIGNKYDMWIKPIGSASYQVYFRYNDLWQPIFGGGVYTAETNPDIHYYNVIEDSSEPSSSIIQIGWFWFNTSTEELFVYNGTNYITMFGAA